MIKKPAVSVIIPAWNASPYLHQCLDSVISQTLTDIEIICVDDGSTDDTSDILCEYAEKDTRISVIRQENRGAGAARNNALKYAKGKYLSFLDADDFFEPEMLEKSFEAAEKHGADVVVFGCDFYSESSGRFRSCPNSINRLILPPGEIFSLKDIRKDAFRLFFGWAWDKLIRTDLVLENSLTFQEQRTTNDMLFVFSALVLSERINVLSELLAHHRRVKTSLSVTREASWDCFFNALIALKKQLLALGLFPRFEQDYINYALHFSLWHLNSLKEPAYSCLYRKMRSEWFDSIGICTYPPEKFYNRHEYRMFRKIYCGDSENGRSGLVTKWADGSIIQRAIKGIHDNGIKYTVEYMILTVLNKRSLGNQSKETREKGNLQ